MGDYRVTAGVPPPLPKNVRRRRAFLFGLLALSVVAAIAAAGFAVSVPRFVMASGYVTTEHYAEVRPAAVGTVAEILVHSGDRVDKSALLVRLDSTEILAEMEEGKSRVSQMAAELERRQAEIAEKKRQMKEDVAIAKLRLQNASAKLVRSQELLRKGLVAGSALEDDKLKEALADAELTSLLGKDESIFDKELVVLRQELAGRQDAMKRIEARLRAREIRAPIAGQVLRYEFVIGELVRPETVLYEIFGGEDQVLKLRVAERYATRVTEGQLYEAELAPYRGLQKRIFAGEVTHLRNVIQAEGQKTYRVAYCTFDAQDLTVPPGTSAEARIYYGSSCLWYYLFGLD